MRGATRIANLAHRVSRWVDRRVEDYRYAERHRIEADAAYETVCTEWPHRRLAASALRRIDEYAEDVYGSRRFAPWLRVYAAWAGEFKEGWIPDNYFGGVVLPAIQGPARELSRFKTLSRRLLLLHPERLPDVAYRIRGRWIDVEGIPIRPADVEEVVFRHGPRVVVKSDDSNQGRSVRTVQRGRDEILALDDLGDVVVQRWVPPSAFLSRFNRDNLATLRITTVRPPRRSAAMRAGFLRFGRPGPEVLTAIEAIRVPVMDRAGTLGPVGAFADWRPVTEHPDSRVPFGGEVIPSFEAARDLCEELHDALPHVAIVGWDIGFTTADDFAILEWNGVHPDVKFTEASTGPDFVDLGWEELWRHQGWAPGRPGASPRRVP